MIYGCILLERKLIDLFPSFSEGKLLLRTTVREMNSLHDERLTQKTKQMSIKACYQIFFHQVSCSKLRRRWNKHSWRQSTSSACPYLYLTVIWLRSFPGSRLSRLSECRNFPNHQLRRASSIPLLHIENLFHFLAEKSSSSSTNQARIESIAIESKFFWSLISFGRSTILEFSCPDRCKSTIRTYLIVPLEGNRLSWWQIFHYNRVKHLE